jgi:hypothetical protein
VTVLLGPLPLHRAALLEYLLRLSARRMSPAHALHLHSPVYPSEQSAFTYNLAS